MMENLLSQQQEKLIFIIIYKLSKMTKKMMNY